MFAPRSVFACKQLQAVHHVILGRAKRLVKRNVLIVVITKNDLATFS
jgi:hypothetical protein